MSSKVPGEEGRGNQSWQGILTQHFRHNGVSDLTIAGEEALRDTKWTWNVLEEETLSDHRYILCNLRSGTGREAPGRWIYGPIEEESFIKRFRKI